MPPLATRTVLRRNERREGDKDAEAVRGVKKGSERFLM
jgi:hypothetical protein